MLDGIGEVIVQDAAQVGGRNRSRDLTALKCGDHLYNSGPGLLLHCRAAAAYMAVVTRCCVAAARIPKRGEHAGWR
jgi:hypothetical protein